MAAARQPDGCQAAAAAAAAFSQRPAGGPAPAACCLVVFVRLPVPGRVKTRLAAGVGPQAACDFYAACAGYTLQLAARCRQAQAAVHYSAGDAPADVQAWMERLGLQGVPLRAQSPDPDLGQKMRHALQHALEEPGVSKALVIGSDIPGLTAEALAAAVAALDTHDVVLGPAVDGGYYLLGVRGRVEPRMLQGIHWSTPTVLAETEAAAAACGLRVGGHNTLPVLQDVDTLEDLMAWRESTRHSVGGAGAAGGAGQGEEQHEGGAQGPPGHDAADGGCGDGAAQCGVRDAVAAARAGLLATCDTILGPLGAG